MGRNHNLFNGTRIGAPLIFADKVIGADDAANGRPIRNIAQKFRESSTFLPSVDWTFDDNITDTTPDPDVGSSGTESINRPEWDDGIRHIHMQENGARLWIFGDNASIAKLASYTLDVPFEIASAQADADLTHSTSRFWRMRTAGNADVGAADSWHWSLDGMRGYMFNSSTIYQYELSTPYTFDPSSAIVAADDSVGNLRRNANYTLSVQNGSTHISRDGRYLIVTGPANSGEDRFISKFEISTPWDLVGSLTSGQHADQSIDVFPAFDGVSAMTNCPIFFSPDGTRMFLQNSSTRVVYQYELSTPWDLDTINQTEINTFTPTNADSKRLSPTYDGKYWYFYNDAAVTGNNDVQRYSQVKHGGNI
jgi:hypothetical protein